MTGINTSNINRIWADLLVEELIRSGAGFFCIAPGSRSAPLAAAVAANARADHIIHFDERGTAFVALGYARATRRPAVWITTSGTAVANGLPAVVEASLDGIPLILLTADRPPELRDTGANQTIDQVKLFGDYVRWQFELPAPDTAVDAAMVLTTADQAVYRSMRAPAGPVHLNCMFREPLAPLDDGRSYDDYLSGLAAWRSQDRPHTRYFMSCHAASDGDMDQLVSSLRAVKQGLLVAGRMDSPAEADAVRWLGDRLGWPLLADVGSQLRLGGPVSPQGAVPYYDLMLASPEFSGRHTPETVLHVGGRLTSKRLTRFAANSRRYIVVRESPSRLDPHHRVTEYVEADIITFCDRLVGGIGESLPGDAAWLESWKSASGAARAAIEKHLRSERDITEPAAARIVSTLTPEAWGLFLASSMPVRDVDMYGSEEGAGPRVGSNRGASGIDGTVASALGFAHGLRAPVTLLAGDLALLHDLNSLALLKNSAFPIVVVAVNNHGGGIFSFLPIAKHHDVFERYFGTPHEMSFEHAAAMFGLSYRRVETWDEMEKVYADAVGSGTSSIIELTTERSANHRLHRHLEERVMEAIVRR